MSSIVYKTILAVGRDCKNQSVLQLLRDNYQFWFPEQRPLFSYASANDKIIIFYPQSSSMSDNITYLKDDEKLTRSELPIGALKFLSDGSSIKIVECKFCTAETFKNCLVLFREYLLETIRKLNLPNYNTINFAIFWDENLLNPIVTEAIKQSGLLTDDKQFAHCFTISEIQGGHAPKPTPELVFGPSKLPYSLQNPYAPVLSSNHQSTPSTTASTPSSGFGFNQQTASSTPSSGFGFNQQSTSSTASSGFGFNQQPAASTPSSGFGFNQPSTASTPSSGFGQQNNGFFRSSPQQSNFAWSNNRSNFFTHK